MTDIRTVSRSRCNVCQSKELLHLNTLGLYHAKGSYMTPIVKCNNCGLFFRDFSYSGRQIENHFAVASYTDLNRENDWNNKRRGFFQFLTELSSRYTVLDKTINVLDYGCSYGHLLEEYNKFNVNCFGVELNDKLRGTVKKKFTNIYKSIEEIKPDIKFNIVTFIDSLYYIEDPVMLLNNVKNRLKYPSILIIRITNRTLLLNLLYKFTPSLVMNNSFGDCKYNFSVRSMDIMMTRAGYKIIKIVLREKGKVFGELKKKMFYNISFLISKIFRIKVTPGLIYIVQVQN